MRVQRNARESGPLPTPEEVQERVRAFVRDDAGFAQVVTSTRDGYPVGRTMIAPIEEDWTVPLVQRRVHHRIEQWRHQPATEIIWVGAPHRDNRNLAPHVYDLLVQVPRVVFLRGDARFLDEDTLVKTYERQVARDRAAGRTLAPVRTRQEVVEELVGVRIVPVRVRAEGFGPGPESWTWEVSSG